MAKTQWIGGNGQGLTYGNLFASGDAGTLANGASVRSSIADITNGTFLDQFMDISFAATITSSSVAAGANLAFWFYALNEDGTHYGDNGLPTAGTPVTTFTPTFPPCATVGVLTGTQTNLYGTATGVVMPPGTFRCAVQNNVGFTFTACTIQYRTYNIQIL